MHEKDIELARLLLGKLSDLGLERGGLQSDLDRLQEELAAQQHLRDERAQYLDILSRAAELLNRQDLHEELPETSELEQECAKLQGQIDELDKAAAQYQQLVDDLDRRAPQLVASARGEREAAPPETEAAASHTGGDLTAYQAMAAGMQPSETEEQPTPEPAVAEAEATLAPEPPEPVIEPEDEAPAAEAGAVAVEQLEPEPVAQEEPASAAPETAKPAPPEESDIDTEASLGRFNLLNLKRRESFTHGRGAAYIIDASSVLERVPNYDHYVRGIELEQAREELIHDFDILGRELSGTFHLVFNSWFQYVAVHGNNLTVEFGTGPGEGTKEASDNRLRELVFEMTAKLRPVCVVTGDSTLADNVRGQGIHIIPLGEFFRA